MIVSHDLNLFWELHHMFYSKEKCSFGIEIINVLVWSLSDAIGQQLDFCSILFIAIIKKCSTFCDLQFSPARRI